MQIGSVAKKIGLSVDAIRFYERNSLLRRAPRTEGGFRQYGEDDLETLAFIRRGAGMGSNQRISSLLDCGKPFANRVHRCGVDWKDKLADVRRSWQTLRS